MAKITKKLKSMKNQAVSQKPKAGPKSNVKLQLKKKTLKKVPKSGRINTNKKQSSLDKEINMLKESIAKVKADLEQPTEQHSEDLENQEMSKNIKCLEEDYKKLVTEANNRTEQIRKLENDDENANIVIRRKESYISTYTGRIAEYKEKMKDLEREKKKIKKKCEDKHLSIIKEMDNMKDLIRKETIMYENHLRKIDYFKIRVQVQEKPIKSLTELKTSLEDELKDIQTRMVCKNVSLELAQKVAAALSLAEKEARGFCCN